MEPFHERYGEVVFDHRARLADKTTIRKTGDLTWAATQILCDPEGEDVWFVEASVDLSDVERLEGPIIAVERIGQ